jgi:hypothetical protein
MSNNRQMSVVMQRLVDFIIMVTNSTLLRNNTVTLLLAGFSVGRSMRLAVYTGPNRVGVSS